MRDLLRLYLFSSRDFQYRPFYMPPDQDSFVCSHPQSNGMTKCSEIPKLRKGNLTCELDFYTVKKEISEDPNKSINGCINWNQYYKFCNVSDKNPYSGSISFDNIGLAWVVIFQVSNSFFRSSLVLLLSLDNQSGKLGEYNVLYSRCSFILGLDLFCLFDCYRLVFYD